MATKRTRIMGTRTPVEVARWIPVLRVKGRSMLPTLTDGQVLVMRPARGRIAQRDIVVFAAADRRLYVKRIAGMPGDVVTLEAGRLYVNGRAWDGSPRVVGVHVEQWRVPEGHCFVVGDNPRESDDSRVWREPFVALARIGGVALGPWRWPWLRLVDELDHRRAADACRDSADPRTCSDQVTRASASTP